MLDILIDALVKFLAWIAPFTLRKVYPPQRIADLVKTRIAADSDGIEYWGGELPRARAWITITNLSPFHIELDRAFGSFAYGAEVEKFVHLQREKIPPTREKSLFLETSLTKEQTAIIQRLRSNNPRPSVSLNALFLCRIHDFEIHRSLETTHQRLVNFNDVAI